METETNSYFSFSLFLEYLKDSHDSNLIKFELTNEHHSSPINKADGETHSAIIAYYPVNSNWESLLLETDCEDLDNADFSYALRKCYTNYYTARFGQQIYFQKEATYHLMDIYTLKNTSGDSDKILAYITITHADNALIINVTDTNY